jgi:hypothetical protein
MSSGLEDENFQEGNVAEPTLALIIGDVKKVENLSSIVVDPSELLNSSFPSKIERSLSVKVAPSLSTNVSASIS